MKVKCLVVLLFACGVVTNCINANNLEKIKHRKKVIKKVRKYNYINTASGNITKEGNRRSSDSFFYSLPADYNSPSSYITPNHFQSSSSHPSYQDDQDTRSLDSLGFLNGASISSQILLSLPVPFCQFTDICKNILCN